MKQRKNSLPIQTQNGSLPSNELSTYRLAVETIAYGGLARWNRFRRTDVLRFPLAKTLVCSIYRLIWGRGRTRAHSIYCSEYLRFSYKITQNDRRDVWRVLRGWRKKCKHRYWFAIEAFQHRFDLGRSVSPVGKHRNNLLLMQGILHLGCFNSKIEIVFTGEAPVSRKVDHNGFALFSQLGESLFGEWFPFDKWVNWTKKYWKNSRILLEY